MTDRKAIKKLLCLLLDYKKNITFIMLLMLLTTGLNLLTPFISKEIMDKGFIGGNQKLLVTLVVFQTAIYIFNALINVLNEKNRITVSTKLEKSLSKQAFNHLLRIRASYFDKVNQTEIMNVMNSDIGNMLLITDRSMFYIVSQIFSITGGLIGLFVIHARLAILVVLFVPLKYLLIRFFAKKNKQCMDEYIEGSREYAGWFGDTLGGIREIRLFQLIQQKRQEFDAEEGYLLAIKKDMNLIGQWNGAADTILIQLLIMTLYILGADMIFHLEATVGSIFAFITYSSLVTSPISSMLNLGYIFAGVLPSTKRFYAFMEQEEEDYDNKNTFLITPSLGSLEFDNVSFAYEEGKEVLENVSFCFERGSKTALVGKNGSGKSTVLDLLLRFYQPQTGRILTRRIPIEYYGLDAYRSRFAVVSQQVYLFNDSIRNNICLDKLIEEEKIWEAVRDSGLEDFVKAVSLDYRVGANGAMLSGGQKQKVALARALVHDRPVLIFDEATSNADVQSEEYLNGLLDTRLKDKTVIIITHRKSVLEKVDHIIELDKLKKECRP